MNICEQAKATIIDATQTACPNINAFCCQALQIRGGRIGSGMGFLLEALWGLYVNQILQQQSVNFELGWFSSHGYNDFACIEKDVPWDSETQMGELMRIEAKSMNLEADESKAHFDELIEELREWDLLLVLIWRWEPVDKFRVCPYIQDYFIGSACSIAMLRDQLHIARGGLVRMLQTSSEQARREFGKIRFEDNTAHEYISFIHRNYPKQEFNQYKKDWLKIARTLNISTKDEQCRELSDERLVQRIRESRPDYQEHLRQLYSTAQSNPLHQLNLLGDSMLDE